MTTNLELVTVRLETKLGAHYTFPHVEKAALEKLCPYMQDGVPEGVNSQLTLINASIAVLSVPIRILKRIEIEEEGTDSLWWRAPERTDECYPASTAKKR